MRRIFVIAFLFCRSASAAEPQDLVDADRNTVEDVAHAPYAAVEKFVTEFRDAVRERSCFKIAALTDFPVRVNFDGNSPQYVETRFLSNRTALCRYFPRIFDTENTEAVMKSPLTPVGWRGLMFGAGAIWIGATCTTRRDPVTRECKTELRFYAANVTAKADAKRLGVIDK